MSLLLYGYGCTVAWNLVSKYFALKRIRDTLGDKIPMMYLVGVDGVVRSFIPILNMVEAMEFTIPLFLSDEEFKHAVEVMVSLMEVEDENQRS